MNVYSTPEIAVRNTDVSTVDGPAGDLIEWARAAQQAYQMAQRLAETSFVPKAMQRRPDEVTGCILAGRELGLSPMAALRSIDVIDGTPAMRAHALRGLVQAHGHEVWVEESNDTRAIVCGRRRAGILGGAGRVEKSTWTIDRAKKAGLAGKRNWQTYPQAMLVARATAEVCRLIAADVLIAMPYTVEELGDGDLTGAPPDEAPKLADAARKRTVKRAPLAAPPAAEPAPEDGALCPVVVQKADEDPQPCGLERPCPSHDGPAISDGQRKALMAAYNDVGLRTRELRLGHASRLIGRPLESANDLTAREAGLILDALAGAGAALPEAAPADAPSGAASVPESTEPAGAQWPAVAAAPGAEDGS